MVQKQAEISQQLEEAGGELSAELKQLAARNIGNRSATWDKAYDLLVKVKEAKVVQAIMVALRGELAKEVERSKLLSKKRARAGGLGLARPCPIIQRVEEEKGKGASLWNNAWGWLRARGGG